MTLGAHSEIHLGVRAVRYDGLIEIVLGRMQPGPALLWLLVQQMGIGAAAGVGVGWMARLARLEFQTTHERGPRGVD